MKTKNVTINEGMYIDLSELNNTSHTNNSQYINICRKLIQEISKNHPELSQEILDQFYEAFDELVDTVYELDGVFVSAQSINSLKSPDTDSSSTGFYIVCKFSDETPMIDIASSTDDCSQFDVYTVAMHKYSKTILLCAFYDLPIEDYIEEDYSPSDYHHDVWDLCKNLNEWLRYNVFDTDGYFNGIHLEGMYVEQNKIKIDLDFSFIVDTLLNDFLDKIKSFNISNVGFNVDTKYNSFDHHVILTLDLN